MRKRHKRASLRRGVAAVEFAVILPVLLLITYGTVGVCQCIFLKEKALLAASQGARVAIKKTATEQDVRTAVRDYLQLREIDRSTITDDCITVTPTPESANKLTPIAVTVRIPLANITYIPTSVMELFSQRTDVESTVVMYKEYRHSSNN